MIGCPHPKRLSDVLPVIAAGGRTVYVPYAITWEHETVVSEDEATYVTASSLRTLLELLPSG